MLHVEHGRGRGQASGLHTSPVLHRLVSEQHAALQIMRHAALGVRVWAERARRVARRRGRPPSALRVLYRRPRPEIG
jgi:hypothetical protein